MLHAELSDLVECGFKKIHARTILKKVQQAASVPTSSDKSLREITLKCIEWDGKAPTLNGVHCGSAGGSVKGNNSYCAVIGGTCGGKPANRSIKVIQFTSENTYKEFSYTNLPFSHYCTAVSHPQNPQMILVVQGKSKGGREAENKSKNVYLYDVLEGEVKTKFLPMKNSRDSAACTISGKYFIVCGGHDGPDQNYNEKNVLKQVELLHLEEQKDWARLPDMQHSRFRHACASFKDKIYALGGLTKKGDQLHCLNSVEVLDLNKKDKKWESMPDMIHPREWHSCAVTTDGILIVVGGQGKHMHDTCEYIDLMCKKPKWKLVKNFQLKHKRNHHGSVVIEDVLYIFGGGNFPIERYDIDI
eukprot:CAMPEP_0185265200 /NCGR_PEP_ID=MMETSP1359-20130426/26816_1 /TAXON_ID=552665 /ORGANISM="Bigelowiella longifila, Strain CCMP242" /LENGTH=358 /DNA_ID=CAMNT_0027854351 /DNA_START=24 /DNA_END=1100 /DNA_ORIENTATION=-